MNLIKWAWYGLLHFFSGDYYPKHQCHCVGEHYPSQRYPLVGGNSCCLRLKGHPGPHYDCKKREWK